MYIASGQQNFLIDCSRVGSCAAAREAGASRRSGKQHRSAVREAGVSRHHGGPIEEPPDK